MIMRRTLLLAVPAAALLPAVGCSTKPRPEDVADLIRNGEYDAARRAAESLLDAGEADARLQMIAGALAFAAEDFARAHELFSAAEDLIEPDDAALEMGIYQWHWLQLTALRAGADVPRRLSGLAGIDPLSEVIAGAMSVDEFVARKVEQARRTADMVILSIAQSPGRDAMLDRMSWKRVPQYHCIGNFAVAQRSIAARDHAGARTLLLAAQQDGAEDLLEYHVAKAELARLG